MRFTIEEYSNAYSISPEMVHSRLRRNRLNYIIEDGTTYIVVPKYQVPEQVSKDESASMANTRESESEKRPAKKTTVATVIGLYQKENRYLKLKIEELEAKVDRLVNEKEQLLKEESRRIEKVYLDKDAQLKTILELVNTKFLHESRSVDSISEQPSTQVIEDADISTEEKIQESQAPVELKQYLRSLDIKSAQRKVIKRRFAKAFGADSRILLHNGLFYLDFDRYDYSDLLKLG